MTALPRPFLKWAGGKTRLVPDLLRHMPLAFNTYHEPVLGGSACLSVYIAAERHATP